MQRRQVIFPTGKENNLATGGTFFNQLTGLRGTLCIHIGEGIIEDGHTAALRKQMVKDCQTESQRNIFFCAFRQLAVIQQTVIAINIHIQLVCFKELREQPPTGTDADIMGKAVSNILHRIVVDILFLPLQFYPAIISTSFHLLFNRIGQFLPNFDHSISVQFAIL